MVSRSDVSRWRARIKWFTSLPLLFAYLVSAQDEVEGIPLRPAQCSTTNPDHEILLRYIYFNSQQQGYHYCPKCPDHENPTTAHLEWNSSFTGFAKGDGTPAITGAVCLQVAAPTSPTEWINSNAEFPDDITCEDSDFTTTFFTQPCVNIYQRESNLPFILGLAIGVPCGVLLIAAIVCIFCIKNKKDKKAQEKKDKRDRVIVLDELPDQELHDISTLSQYQHRQSGCSSTGSRADATSPAGITKEEIYAKYLAQMGGAAANEEKKKKRQRQQRASNPFDYQSQALKVLDTQEDADGKKKLVVAPVESRDNSPAVSQSSVQEPTSRDARSKRRPPPKNRIPSPQSGPGTVTNGGARRSAPTNKAPTPHTSPGISPGSVGGARNSLTVPGGSPLAPKQSSHHHSNAAARRRESTGAISSPHTNNNILMVPTSLGASPAAGQRRNSMPAVPTRHYSSVDASPASFAGGPGNGSLLVAPPASPGHRPGGRFGMSVSSNASSVYAPSPHNSSHHDRSPGRFDGGEDSECSSPASSMASSSCFSTAFSAAGSSHFKLPAPSDDDRLALQMWRQEVLDKEALQGRPSQGSAARRGSTSDNHRGARRPAHLG